MLSNPFDMNASRTNATSQAATFVVVWIAFATATTTGAQSVEFADHIAPIFAEHCVRCHSPGNAKGEISIATFVDLKDNEYVIAGDPDGSHLLAIITATDGQSPAMPKEGKPLSEHEVELIRGWISQGANWPHDVVVGAKSKADGSWWSLQPLRTTFDTAQADDATAAEQKTNFNIDQFVRAKLAEHELPPSPPADRRTLIRRLSFDLHGLPPSPEAVEAYVNDVDPHAYEKLVDQMLESPQYGERFARHWLDIAHYADTHGFERDQRRDNAWRYRDYVIDSFNEDKPYDRFLQEQIAGDVLWPDDPQAVIATGFLVAGPWDFVGHVETKSPMLRRSARSLDLDDMATQVMTATMAMTVNCARCHDHKLDPISQQEYYQLQAVFAGVKRDDRVVSDASVKQYELDKQAIIVRLNEMDLEIRRLEGRGFDLADVVGGGDGLGTGEQRHGIDARTAQVQTRDFGKLDNVVTNVFSKSAFDFVDGVFIPDGQAGEAKIPVSSTAVTITGLPTTSGDAWDMIRNGPVASQHSSTLGGIDFTRDGHSLIGLHANAGITFDLAAIRGASSDGELRFTAKVGYFGAQGKNCADAWVFVDGEKAAEFKQLRREDGLQNIDLELPKSARFLTLVATDGGNGFSMDQIGFGDPRVIPASTVQLSEDDRQLLTQLRQEQLGVKTELDSFAAPPKFYGPVAEQELPAVRLLMRGDPESPTGDDLAPGAFRSLAMLNPDLGSSQSGEGERRAALARWITHPDNPLTSRVIVNRLWQWHFGTGIVDTPSDFGFGGGQPSHLDLLDSLAAELARRDWSLKAMHRLILNSETYKQHSVTFADQKAALIDADNRLLWRQNPRRIEAEVIRDTVLFVSGKLNSQRSGPGFEDFRYQEEYAPIYTYITADEPALWRRSIYRYIVRTTPNRFLTTLDCPDPANLTPKRLTTTTPLQSLALYNNEFMLKQAQYFAERIVREAGTHLEDQVRRAFELALVRTPSEQELRLATDFTDQQGLFALCRSLFNSNEFVYVD